MPTIKFDKIDLIMCDLQALAEHHIRDAYGQECRHKHHAVPRISLEVYGIVVERLIANGEAELKQVREDLEEERRNPKDECFRMHLENRLREMGEQLK